MFKIQDGNYFPIVMDGITTVSDLPVGNFSVNLSPMGYFLSCKESYSLPDKMYGNPVARGNRILRTFRDRKNKSTGVMLLGEKGSGKTLLAKHLSVEAAKLGYPTITVSDPYTGTTFHEFISRLPPSVVIFDEFEKVYDRDEQKSMLTLFDGVVSTQKLFIITANDKYSIDNHFTNRPGRVYYYIEYNGIDEDVIREYCNDILHNKKHVEDIVQFAKYQGKFTFDMLSALVEEMNRQQQTALECLDILNIREDTFSSISMEYVVKIGQTIVPPKKYGITLRSKDGDRSSSHIMACSFINVNFIHMSGHFDPEDMDCMTTEEIVKLEKELGRAKLFYPKEQHARIQELNHTVVFVDREKDFVSYDSKANTYHFYNKEDDITVIASVVDNSKNPPAYSSIFHV